MNIGPPAVSLPHPGMKLLPPSPAARASFFRELARLTGAGLSVTKAAEILNQRWRDPKVTAAVRSLHAGLAKGETIADSLAPELSGMEMSMVSAAEKGGKLAEGFRRLEDYYHLLAATVSRMKKALIYPAFMLHAAVILPAIVTGVISGAGLLSGIFTGLLQVYGTLAVLWFGGRWLLDLGNTNVNADRFLELIPVTGPARRCLALARWNTVLHFHLLTGRKMSEGLLAAGDAARTARLLAASGRVAAVAEGGGEIGPALQDERAFPDEIASSLAAAEFTGTLDAETSRQARELNIEAALRMDTAAEWVPKALYFAVMAFTVYQILRMAGGYFTMLNKGIQDLGY